VQHWISVRCEQGNVVSGHTWKVIMIHAAAIETPNENLLWHNLTRRKPSSKLDQKASLRKRQLQRLAVVSRRSGLRIAEAARPSTD